MCGLIIDSMDYDRLRKLEEIKKLGITPYAEKYERTHSLKEAFEGGEGTKVKVAGRIMTLREMGKLAFAHLQDFSGRMQIAFQVDEIGKEKMKFLRLLDLGDFIGVEGEVFTTHKGEVSVLVKELTFLSKTLLPLPEKWHGLKDKEACYRQRYLDMVSNRETLDRFVLRSAFIKALREFYWVNGFTEIETPYLASTASGALARPFVTHHNALDHDFFLRIAIETPQKEATVGGFEKVFEIGKVFRNEGMDPSHLQEFTMCEHYAAFWNYEDNMDFTEEMFHYLLDHTLGSRKVEIADRDGKLQKVDFGKKWRRVAMHDLIKEDCGVDYRKFKTVDKLRAEIKKKKIEIDDLEKLGRGNMIDSLYKKVSRPKLIQPTFLMKHPVDLSPLARRNDEDSEVTDRFQLVVNGWEIVNAYSELVDPVDQEKRFEQQSEALEAGDADAHGKDDDFVKAMSHGMPPQSGWGMGIDRIMALLTQSDNLKDVVMFPLMRPLHQDRPRVVVGRVEEIEAHENKPEVKFCTVNCGPFGMKMIVTNCQNIREGLVAPVAFPGIEILEWQGTGKVAYVVETRKAYGFQSEAVLCAREELGVLEPNEKKRELIMELDENEEVGVDFEKVREKYDQ
jgi:lysyl-tRNA synthetase, class II